MKNIWFTIDSGFTEDQMKLERYEMADHRTKSICVHRQMRYFEADIYKIRYLAWTPIVGRLRVYIKEGTKKYQ